MNRSSVSLWTKGTSLLVVGLMLAACSVVQAERPGGGGGGGRPGGGGGHGGGRPGGGVHGVRRPLVVGTKQGFAGRPIAGRGPLAAGSSLGYRNGLGYGGVGYGGFGYGGYGGYGYGDSQGTLLYRLNYIPVPPYFSLHPPVYYGQRIFRTYGDSPFASQPYARAYGRQSQPQMVTNPMIAVVPVAQKKSEPRQLAAQVVVNPFYEEVAERQPEIVAQTSDR